MVDQPGTGTGRSYKIRGHTRQRRTTKPYSRPSEVKKKGLIETVRDYLSPSWFFGYFQTNEVDPELEDSSDSEVDVIDDDAMDNEQNSVPARDVSKAIGLPSINEEDSFLGAREITQVVTSSGLKEQDCVSDTDHSHSFEYLENNNKGEPCTDDGVTVQSHEDWDGDDDEDEGNILDPVTETQAMETPAMETPTASSSLSYSSQLKRKPLPSILHSRTMTSRLFQHSENPASLSLGLTPRTSTHSFKTPSIIPVNTLPGNVMTSSTGLRRSKPVSSVTSTPAFSVSTFVTPVPRSFTNKRTESPFYPGKVTYGGALTNSGYTNHSGKRQRRHSPGSEAYQPVRKQQIRAKPLPNATKGGTSQTAQRILEALESVSSPLKDVHRIPSPLTSPSASPLSFSPSKTRTRPPRHFGPRVTSLQAKLLGRPPVETLCAPQTANVTSIDRREPSNPKTSSSPFPTADNSSSRWLEKSLFSSLNDTVLKTSLPTAFTPKALPTSLSPGEKTSKNSGKMRSALHGATHYSLKNNADDEEVVNPLPEIVHAVPLPMSTIKNKSQFFSTSSKAPETVTSQKKSENRGKPLEANSSLDKAESTKNGFIFSTPKPKAPAVTVKEALSKADDEVSFMFCQPVSIKGKENKDMNTESVKDFSKNHPFNSTSSSYSFTTTSTPLISSKSSATQNSLAKMFGAAPGDWECSSCMVRNKAADQKCVACTTSKTSREQHTKSGATDISSNGIDLATKFAPAVGSWNCGTCSVNNKSIAVTCVACNAEKPPEKSTSSVPAVNKGAENIDLKAKFARPANSWECATCMVGNTSGASECVACTAAKPGTSTTENHESDLKKRFAAPAGSWECEACMVNNQSSAVTCVACQTSKPGTETQGGNQPTFTFGLNIPSTDISSSATSAFTFGGGAVSGSSKPSGFTFGSASTETTTTTTTTGFTFGSKSTEEQDTTSGESGQSVNTGGSFTFGGSDKKSSSNEGNAPLNIAQAAAAGLLKVPGVGVSDSNSRKATTQPTFLPQSSDTQPSGSASFIAPPKNLPDSTTVPPAATATTKDATPSLTATAKSTSGTKITPFNFGASAASSTVSSSTVAATSAQTPLGGNPEKPGFGFGVVPASKPSTTLFNFTPQPSAAASDKKDGKPAFAFGNTANNASEKSAAGVFKFGAAGQSTAVSETPLFQNAVAVTSSAVVSETKTQSSGLFTFTSAPTVADKSKQPAFNFGNLNGPSSTGGTAQQTQDASAGNALFVFNSAQPSNADALNHNSPAGEEMEADSNSNHDSGQPAFGSSGGFNFPGQTPGNTSGLFGSSGTSGTAGFNFGSGGSSIPTAFQFGTPSNTNNNTPSGGFSFAASTASGGGGGGGGSPFQFGGSGNSVNPTTNSSAGFNFNAAAGANNTPAAQFNLSQGSTGGGGFSVGATGQNAKTPQSRVIKKAIRRQRR